MGTRDTLVEFRRSGGQAGNDEHLVVDRDGHATLRTPDGTQNLQLGPATVEQLRRELATARFAQLAEDLRRPPEGEEPQPDVVDTPSPPTATPSERSAVRSRRSCCPWSRR